MADIANVRRTVGWKRIEKRMAERSPLLSRFVLQLECHSVNEQRGIGPLGHPRKIGELTGLPPAELASTSEMRSRERRVSQNGECEQRKIRQIEPGASAIRWPEDLP